MDGYGLKHDAAMESAGNQLGEEYWRDLESMMTLSIVCKHSLENLQNLLEESGPGEIS